MLRQGAVDELNGEPGRSDLPPRIGGRTILIGTEPKHLADVSFWNAKGSGLKWPKHRPDFRQADMQVNSLEIAAIN